MFVYIFFLRPPPLQSTTSGIITVTPQISNDLRTEPFHGSHDIFYSWVQVQTAYDEHLIKAKKLTTWRQSNAYKEVKVPLPPGVQDVQSWRLVLSTKPYIEGGPQFFTIDLYDQSLGTVPFPVMSMPIIFGSNGAKRDGKQEKIERIYRLRADESGPFLKITEQTSFDLDKKIWDSGIGLSSWLVGLENGSQTATGDVALLKDILFSDQPRNILELGAGTGIVALTLATLISGKSMNFGSHGCIMTTDLESAMPLLEHNITNNAHLFHHIRPSAVVFDWDDDTLPDFIQTFNEGFDAIVMADVTYNTASFPSLVRTLAQLIRLGTRPPMVLMGYKERDVAERTLWNLVAEVGLHFVKIGECAGAGGSPVEIWLGRATHGTREVPSSKSSHTSEKKPFTSELEST